MNPILHSRMRRRVSKTTPKWQPDGEYKWQDVEIPCPDNKPGCIVVHYGKRMVWVPDE